MQVVSHELEIIRIASTAAQALHAARAEEFVDRMSGTVSCQNPRLLTPQFVDALIEVTEFFIDRSQAGRGCVDCRACSIQGVKDVIVSERHIRIHEGSITE